jgi:beta-xylosidase
MAEDASRTLGEGQIVFFDPERHPTIEGPKFYKRNGFYYILAPAGGVPRGWQVALRSRSVYGPYEDRVVLEQGRTPVNGPHQGALVDAQDGSSWFVHFQDRGLYGRVVHLNPVEWSEGWPLMGVKAEGSERREPVLRHRKPALPSALIQAPVASDEFKAETLNLAWQWQANHRADFFSLSAARGHLRLFALAFDANDLGRRPNVVLQKLPARSFQVETAVRLASGEGGVRGGLVVMGEHHAALSVESATDGQRLVLSVDNREVESFAIGRGPVVLRVSMRDGGLCDFSFEPAGAPERRLETAFQAHAGRWIGAKVGLFALPTDSRTGSYADFAYFRFSPP